MKLEIFLHFYTLKQVFQFPFHKISKSNGCTRFILSPVFFLIFYISLAFLSCCLFFNLLYEGTVFFPLRPLPLVSPLPLLFEFLQGSKLINCHSVNCHQVNCPLLKCPSVKCPLSNIHPAWWHTVNCHSGICLDTETIILKRIIQTH